MSRFRFVSEFAPDYGVKRLCRVLKVSRSGYYTWCRRPPSPHSVRDVELAELIGDIHRHSRRTYGAPRVHAELRRLDQHCGRKRVARLMAAHGLVGAHARRRWRTGKPDTAPAPDLVKRNFDPERADQVWAADVTQFWTVENWLYFAGVIDLFSRRVVGWAMSSSPDADLVIDALVMAFERRRPDEKPIHHSDRGGIYTSLAFGKRASELGITRSFGSTGTATTTPLSRLCGPRSSASCSGSTAERTGRRVICCAQCSSTTSRASTTPRGPRCGWATVPRPSSNQLQWLNQMCALERVNTTRRMS